MPIPPAATPKTTFNDLVRRASYGIQLARMDIRGEGSEPSALAASSQIASTAHMVQDAQRLSAPAAAHDHAAKALAQFNTAYDVLGAAARRDPDWPARNELTSVEAALSQAGSHLWEAARLTLEPTPPR